MPTYQYACTACDHRFETVQSFSDAALTECPECSGRLRKLFGSVGIVFKGSGFYRTDSRAGGSGKKDKADSGGTDSSKSGNDAKGSGSSDSSDSSGSGSGNANSSSSSSSTTSTSSAAS